jgi:hypothetical protein
MLALRHFGQNTQLIRPAKLSPPGYRYDFRVHHIGRPDFVLGLMILFILRHFFLLFLSLNSTLINREELSHLFWHTGLRREWLVEMYGLGCLTHEQYHLIMSWIDAEEAVENLDYQILDYYKIIGP